MIDPSEFERSRDRIVNTLSEEGYTEPEKIFEETSQEVDLYVHPGYGGYTDLIDETLGLSHQDHEEFAERMYESLDESARSQRNTAVLYPENRLEETENFLSPVDTEGIAYIPTEEQSALPGNASGERGLISGESMIAGLLNGVEDGGTVNIYGETRHMCTSNARWLVENVEPEVDKSYEVNEKELFPDGVMIPTPIRAVHLGGSMPEAVRDRAGDFVESFYTPEGF